VIAVLVWHHVGDWRAATREARRALRPGGTLILADLLRDAFRGPGRRVFPPAATYALDDLLAEIGAAGFRDDSGPSDRQSWLPAGRSPVASLARA
jgi:SAM-dependent methyltransferase